MSNKGKINADCGYFEEVARRAFRFLETDYGFALAIIERGSFGPGAVKLRYESADVFVQMHYVPFKCEVVFSVGRKNAEGQSGADTFSDADLALLSDQEEWKEYRAFMLSGTRNSVEKCVAKLARLLRECGTPCLQGGVSAFKELSQTIKRRRADREKEQKNRRLP